MLWISYLLLSAFGAANAVTLVVLPFADKSESTNQPQWEVGIPFLLKEQLRQIDPIRILPDGSVEFGPDDTADYGYQQVHEQSDWSVGDSRKLGEAVEAQVVVDGSYAIHGGRCSISLRLVHVLTGASSGFLTVQGAGWFEAICEAQKLILDQLHLVPGREAERRMSTPPTKSPAALEAFARGLAGKNNGAPVSAIEKDLRNATALDSGFVMAQEALALVLSLEGHDEEALKLVAPIVRKDGHSATGHYILATVYSSQDRNGEAEAEFQEAQRLDPNEPLTIIRYGEVCVDEGKLPEAISAFKKAKTLEPYSALMHLDLAHAYARTADPDKARKELRTAEHLDAASDLDTLQQLAEVSELLNQAPAAAGYYTRFVESAKALGVSLLVISNAEDNLAELKARLSPHFVHAAMPRVLSPSDLKTAFKTLLTRQECSYITNPFATTPPMVRWAKRHVAGAHSDLEKAQKLFAGITPHLDVGELFTDWTARQAFEALSNPKAPLSCQNYTFLYVALARSVGLKSFYVLVNRDVESNLVAHACAGVFIGGRTLLVDPTYGWFGVPHVDFTFEDDLSATALFLADTGSADLVRLGVKLRPDWALPRFLLTLNLAWNGAPQEARQALGPALKMDSKSWWSFLARGSVEYAEDNGPAAVKDLQACFAMQPQFDQVSYALAKAYQSCGKLAEAREQYRNFLNAENLPDLVEEARHQITIIDAKLDASEVKAREK